MKKNVIYKYVLPIIAVSILFILIQKIYRHNNPSGKYLVNGGLSFVIIEQKSLKEKLRDSYNRISTLLGNSPAKKTEEWEMFEFRCRENSPKANISFLLELRRGVLEIYSINYRGEIDPEISGRMVPSGNLRGDWDLRRPESSEEISKPSIDYFHKVYDKRIDKYFEELYNYDVAIYNPPAPGQSGIIRISPVIYEYAESLIKDYPDDHYIRTIYYDSLIRCGNLEELKNDLDKHRDFYSTTDKLCLKSVYEKCRLILKAKELSESGKNGWDLIEKMVSKDTTLSERLSLLPDMKNYKEFIKCYKKIVKAGEIADFMTIQTFSKTLLIISYMKMLEGKREEARDYLINMFRIGNVMCLSSEIIDHFIGIAVKAITVRGLDIYVKNCCETREEIASVTHEIEKLNEENIVLEDSLKTIQKHYPIYHYKTPGLEISVRTNTTTSKLQNLRMSAAVRKSRIETHLFPKDEEYFKQIFNDKYPMDPFSGSPMKYIAGDEECVVYSVGPDQKDDQAVFEYDPTNGTVSAGDIISKMPPARRYPFPKDGLKANSKEDVERVFPNGLPWDNFADTRTRGLNITNTKPVKIYSYGPDTNEAMAQRDGDNYVPDTQYDPTNGTVSTGDIFWEVPTK